ncbi:unnamed protein product [Mytilus coruscus]|uniref:ATPase AAA-type core domain-containing protein n=1 Tax=Mytilus coruscus TaxID=42192 RepID=A0A6J8CYV0_MYTCO|nr:unnamed protein product [Mytilus coruscus]
MYNRALVHPFTFKKDSKDKYMIVVYNSETNGDRLPLLKTSEGILEAEQLILLLSQKNIFTITKEEPDRGMHPQMFAKMRNWIFKKVRCKSLLIITHNLSMLDHSVVDRTHICSKRQYGGNVFHDVIKFSTPLRDDHIYRKYSRVEEMKNILFSHRILFVEGFTDKIILESMFDVLFNDQDLKYAHRGAIEAVIDTVANEVDQETKDRLEIPMNSRKNYAAGKKSLVTKSDKDISKLAKTIILNSKDFARFSDVMWRMMTNMPTNGRKRKISDMNVAGPSSDLQEPFHKRRSPRREIDSSDTDLSPPNSPSKGSKRRSPRHPSGSPRKMDTTD